MYSIILFNNLTIFSVLNLILTHQEYRIAYIFVTNNTNDFSSKIAELAWDHMIPLSLISLDNIQTGRRYKYDEPMLNVIMLNNQLDTEIISKVKKYLLPNDITVILVTSVNSNVNQVNYQLLMKLSVKVLILSKTFLISLNQFHVNQINNIQLNPYNGTATQQFLKEFLNKEFEKGGNMTIFMRHSPPKSYVAPMLGNDNYTFNGPDGVIADLLVKSLNATPTYVTDMEILFPLFKSWKMIPAVESRLHYYGYHKEATTSNVFSTLNTTMNSKIDFHLSTHVVEPDEIDDAHNLSTVRLYPNGKDCLLIVVPKQFELQNFLTKFIKNGDVQSIFCALLLFVIVRIVIQRAQFHEWLSITFQTLQLFLVQGKTSNRNSFEVRWAIVLRGFSFFAITAISAILYKSLVTAQNYQIDTIEDLIESNLTIFVPKSLSSQFDRNSTSMNFKLRNAMVFKTDEEFGDALFSRMFNAYVCHEGQGQFLLKMKTSIGKDNGVELRIMKERILCRLTSYRIDKASPFKRITNDFIMRCFENGLYDKVLDWADRLNKALFPTNNVMPERYEKVLELGILFTVFKCYFAGMLFSSIVFVLEICV